MSGLETPDFVAATLREATVHLGKAHAAASECEGDRRGLNGAVRDLIFGLNTATDALAQMINRQRSSTADGSRRLGNGRY